MSRSCSCRARRVPSGSRFAADWIAAPYPDAAPTVAIEGHGRTVQWRPGRAIVVGDGACPDDIITALVDFAFYEGELRDLELALKSREAELTLDVRRAYRIRFKDRQHWKRFTEMIESFCRMRLMYAQLGPRLSNRSRGGLRAAWPWFARL